MNTKIFIKHKVLNVWRHQCHSIMHSTTHWTLDEWIPLMKPQISILLASSWSYIYRSEETIFAKKLEMVLITYMMNSKKYQSSHNYHWEGQEVGSLPTQTTYAFQVILRRTPTKIITHVSRKHLKFPTMYSQHQPEDGMWSLISVFMIPTKTRANILVILKHRNLPRKISVIFLKHNWYIFLKRILVKLLVCMWLFTMVTIH